MTTEDKPIADTATRALIVKVVERANAEERLALAEWAKQLIAIRDGDLSPAEKMKHAIALTHRSKAILPFIAAIGFEIKRLGWDERSWAARIGLSAALATAAVVGGEGAGIAALGGAIGVPLWILFGAGGVAAGALIDEATKSRS
ncbi:hypothetical protein [Trinickia mobilis]|uniref:hypothetical protein n=1 Tax=Trinickia mobilis TaxID=2816356 RepID=UPI001A8E89CF|nr:hypothetical protein [Trinickia mobilis]